MTTTEVNPPVHFNDPSVAQLTAKERNMLVSPYSVKTMFINHLPVAVSIKQRSGFGITIPPLPVMHVQKFIVRTEIEIHQSLRKQVAEFLAAVNEASSGELKAMREAFNFNTKENNYGSVTIILDYGVSLEELKSYGGTLYFHDADTLISLSSVCDMPHHPASEAGRMTNITSPLTLGGFSYVQAIDIVDNHGTFGDKFIKKEKDVYRVRAKTSTELKDGIYITGNRAVKNNLSPSDVVVDYRPYADAEKLFLYSSFDEAMNSGVTEADMKRELLEIEHVTQKSKAEMQQLKAQHDKEMLEKEAKLKTLQMNNDQVVEELRVNKLKLDQARELEMLHAKAVSDHRSYDRKDSSEMIKFVPTIVAGLAAVFFAFKKFF